MSDTTARLTAIAEKLAKRNWGHRITMSDDGDLAFVLAHVETLTQQVADLEATIEGINASEDIENRK